MLSDNLYSAVGSNNAIFGWNVNYDGVGNIKQLNDSFAMGNWDYTYDTMNRLSTAVASLPYAGWEGSEGATITGTGCQYTYDPYGNRITEAPYSTGKSCYNSTHAYGSNRVSGYQYDAAGNLTNDGTYTYTYDGEERLATISGTGVSATYFYDPEGQRVASTVNGATSEFARDPQGNLAWTNFSPGGFVGGPATVFLNGRHFGYVYINTATGTLNHVLYSQVDAVGTERGQFDGSQNRLATFTSNAVSKAN